MNGLVKHYHAANLFKVERIYQTDQHEKMMTNDCKSQSI